jgi:nucleoside-diphosphate-sugar epimerase
MQRQPDISLANRVLGWSPKVDLVEGLGRYIDWMRAERDQP